MDGALFFGDEDRVGEPRGVLDGKNKLACCNLSILALMAIALVGCIGRSFCRMGGESGHISM